MHLSVICILLYDLLVFASVLICILLYQFLTCVHVSLFIYFPPTKRSIFLGVRINGAQEGIEQNVGVNLVINTDLLEC